LSASLLNRNRACMKYIREKRAFTMCCSLSIITILLRPVSAWSGAANSIILSFPDGSHAGFPASSCIRLTIETACVMDACPRTKAEPASGGTLRAAATVGTAVFRIVVSRDSIKNAAPTSQSRRTLSRLVVEESTGGATGWSTLLANMNCQLTRSNLLARDVA
jgi:hypothetical protein